MVYTPVVGQACQQFSHIYRQPARPVHLLPACATTSARSLRNRPNPEVDVIVVTDGERILGHRRPGRRRPGHPDRQALPVHADRRHPPGADAADRAGRGDEQRRSGSTTPSTSAGGTSGSPAQDYFDFVDQFVAGRQAGAPERLPAVGGLRDAARARRSCERYRDELLTFNDDIQGTAAVALGAILGAVGVTGRRLARPADRLPRRRLGRRSAWPTTCVRRWSQDGLSEEEARRRFWIVDKDGLLHDGPHGPPARQARLRPAGEPASPTGRAPRRGSIGLAEVIGQVDPTILIGLSTVGGAFTEAIVREMARKVERPIIFPLSNPTSHSPRRPPRT